LLAHEQQLAVASGTSCALEGPISAESSTFTLAATGAPAAKTALALTRAPDFAWVELATSFQTKTPSPRQVPSNPNSTAIKPMSTTGPSSAR